MTANLTTTRITVNGKLTHYSIDQIFDKKYTKLEFTTYSFSAKLINKLNEYMSLQGVIGSYTNLSLANNPNFLYALGRVHTKVMLLSNEQGDLRVITGSANLSIQALDENASQGENIVIVDNNQKLFNQWHDYFEQLWNLAKETKQPTLGKYIKPKKALTPKQLQNSIAELDSKIDTLKEREYRHKKQIKKLKELKSIKEINQLKSDNKRLKNNLQELNSQIINTKLSPLITGSYAEKEQLLDILIGLDKLRKQIKHAKSQYYTDKNLKSLTIGILNTSIAHIKTIKYQLTDLHTLLASDAYNWLPKYQQTKLKYINTQLDSMNNLLYKYENLKIKCNDLEIATLRNTIVNKYKLSEETINNTYNNHNLLNGNVFNNTFDEFKNLNFNNILNEFGNTSNETQVKAITNITTPSKINNSKLAHGTHKQKQHPLFKLWYTIKTKLSSKQ